ncbi:hypothetical protein GF336_05640 [Candidatus Woesearchaeota archaeon]|nr:hypothetical protein [Candidatus Woesearchaeota archaeon]
MERDIRKLELNLSFDENYGILNRSGLLNFARKQPRGIKRHVIFIDIDNLHALNQQNGYEAMNNRLRAMFSIETRQSDCFIGKFFSGDEILCVTGTKKQDAEAVLEKLKRAATKNELSFTYALGTWNTSENLEREASKLAEKVLKIKSDHRKDVIKAS